LEADNIFQFGDKPIEFKTICSIYTAVKFGDKPIAFKTIRSLYTAVKFGNKPVELKTICSICIAVKFANSISGTTIIVKAIGSITINVTTNFTNWSTTTYASCCTGKTTGSINFSKFATIENHNHDIKKSNTTITSTNSS
jgi:hypothetical protein